MTVFWSCWNTARCTSRTADRKTLWNTLPADQPVDDALDHRAHGDQVGPRVDHEIVGDPGGDLGTDGLVVERRARPVGELVRIEQGAVRVTNQGRDQQQDGRQDRQRRSGDPSARGAHAGSLSAPSTAPRSGAANLAATAQGTARHSVRRRATRSPRGPDQGRRGGRPARLRLDPPVPARGAARGRRGARRPPGAAGRRRRPLAPATSPRDLGAYLAPRRVRYYPSRGTGYESHLAPPPHLVGLRIDALDALVGDGDERAAVVVASAVALAEAVPDASLRPAGFALTRGEEIDLGDVAELLVAAGYERVEQVEERGQFAVRGGILDVFPATEERAVRIELFGDEIESMRWFSTFTQRSLGEAERVELAPAAELDARAPRAGRAGARRSAEEEAEPPSLAELLPLDRFGAPLDLIAERDRGRPRRRRGDRAGAARPLGRRRRRRCTTTTPATSTSTSPSRSRERALADRRGRRRRRRRRRRATPFRALEPRVAPRAASARPRRELEKQLRSGYRTVVAFEQPRRGRARPLRPRPPRRRAPRRRSASARPAVALRRGARSRDGFVSPRAAARRRSRSAASSTAAAPPAPAPPRGRLARFSDLRVGDYVVHEDHGVARFAGFETRDGRRRHPRLPLARVPRRGPRLRPHRPAGEDHPLRRRRRRAAAALGARRQALGEHEGAGPPRRRRAGRRAAQPLRRAPGAPRPRVRARRRVAAASSSARSRTARPPTSSRRSRRSRATWSRSGRWTG